MRITPGIVLFFLSILQTTAVALATPPSVTQVESLNAMAEFADNYCKVVPLSGTATASEVGAKVDLSIQGLLKKLLSAGASGHIDYKSEKSVGLVREQLQAALSRNVECRVAIWGDLKRFLIFDAPPKRVEIIETGIGLLHLEDINCYKLVGQGACDFWVTWAQPAPGMQAILRVGENDEGYFACGSSSDRINSKLAPWATTSGPTKIRYYQVPATGPNNGCTDQKPSGRAVAESIIQVR